VGLSVEELMKSIREGTVEETYLISDHEYEDEFLSKFNFGLDYFHLAESVNPLQNTKHYYLSILTAFNNHIILEDSIYKYLQVLDFCQNGEKKLEHWKYLISQCQNIVRMFHITDIKKKISELFKLNEDHLKHNKREGKKHSILEWKVFKDY